jgi:hypothetical protein
MSLGAPVSCGDEVDPTSQFLASAILLIQIGGYKNVWRHGDN